jgi:phage-related protein
MGQTEWKIEYYEKGNGHCPIIDFLNEIKKDSKSNLVLINKAFDRLKLYGNGLGRPYVAPLRDHIRELRVKTNHGNYRFLYFFYHEVTFVFTHGFKKKGQKVPDTEIDKAIEYKKDYFAQHGEVKI